MRRENCHQPQPCGPRSAPGVRAAHNSAQHLDRRNRQSEGSCLGKQQGAGFAEGQCDIFRGLVADQCGGDVDLAPLAVEGGAEMRFQLT